MTRPRALVIGGSVGGLFAAHLLRSIGWDVAVFERAAGDLGDRGTGIGTREELFAVMRRIGIAADASIGIDVEGRVGLDRRRPRHLASYRCAPSPAPGRASGGRCGRRGRTTAMPAARRCAGSSRAESSVVAMFERWLARRALISWSPPTACIPRFARSTFPRLAPRYAGYVAWRGVVEADSLSPDLHALVLHRMVFGFPDGELMLSIPMPAPRGDGKRACHFVWFRPAAESALADLCTDASGNRHGVSIPPPLIRPELIAALKRDADALLGAAACRAGERHGADHPAADLRA